MSYAPTHPEPGKGLFLRGQSPGRGWHRPLNTTCFKPMLTLSMPMACLGVKRGSHTSTGTLKLLCPAGPLPHSGQVRPHHRSMLVHEPAGFLLVELSLLFLLLLLFRAPKHLSPQEKVQSESAPSC